MAFWKQILGSLQHILVVSSQLQWTFDHVFIEKNEGHLLKWRLLVEVCLFKSYVVAPLFPCFTEGNNVSFFGQQKIPPDGGLPLKEIIFSCNC